MHTLSRAVFDDAIEMTLRCGRLDNEQKARLVRRLQRVRDGLCDRAAACAECPGSCACERLVRQAFTGDAWRLSE